MLRRTYVTPARARKPGWLPPAFKSRCCHACLPAPIYPRQCADENKSPLPYPNPHLHAAGDAAATADGRRDDRDPRRSLALAKPQVINAKSRSNLQLTFWHRRQTESQVETGDAARPPSRTKLATEEKTFSGAAEE